MRAGGGAVVVVIILVRLGDTCELRRISADLRAEIATEIHISADLRAALQQLFDSLYLRSCERRAAAAADIDGRRLISRDLEVISRDLGCSVWWRRLERRLGDTCSVGREATFIMKLHLSWSYMYHEATCIMRLHS